METITTTLVNTPRAWLVGAFNTDELIIRKSDQKYAYIYAEHHAKGKAK